MKLEDASILPQLRLPKRYEILEKQAQESGLDPREFVERVDNDAGRVDILLRNIQVSGCGQLELFLGLSGSGKTTFVSTLPKFFHDVGIHKFPHTAPLAKLPRFVAESARTGEKYRVILIEERDNPKQTDLEGARDAFDELRRVFRSDGGDALVLWPITAADAARSLAAIAWEVGRDSVVDHESRGLHHFGGLEKEKYFEVADTTARNLSGDGLEAFGVTSETAAKLLPGEVTITGFYAKLEAAAAEVRGQTLSVLKQRVRPQVWVVLPGDVLAQVDATVSSLTQGTRSRVDVDLIAEFIDSPSTEANYIADWKQRRSRLAHIMRALDVRLFGLPPNVALAAIRAYGDPSTKKLLKQGSTNAASARGTLRRSRLYKAIITEADEVPEPFGGGGAIATETENEYRRIQATASKGDAMLNKALGVLISETLKEDGVEAEVVVEKQKLPGSRLRPDVQIQIADNSFICLEPTWRSTDTGIPGELKGGQNTLSPSHIKKYLLDKVTEYVKDLEL